MKWSLVAFRQDYPRLNNVDHLKKDPASACFLCSCPDICSSHEAIKQQNSVSLENIDARNIDIYSKERHGAPDSLFCRLLPMLLMMLAGWSVAARPKRIKSPAPEHQRAQPSAIRVFGSLLPRGACLLGKIATAFCRDRQLERSGDVIC